MTKSPNLFAEYFRLLSQKMFNMPPTTFASNYSWYADALKLIEVAADWKLGEENGNFVFLVFLSELF